MPEQTLASDALRKIFRHGAKRLKRVDRLLAHAQVSEKNHARAKTVGALGALAIADYIKSIPAIKNLVK